MTSTAAAGGAVVAAVVSFGFAMWASTSDDGAPSWRNHASLAAAFTCVALLGAALTIAGG